MRQGPVRSALLTLLVLVMEAFEGSWRKTPSVKRLVFRSMTDETTRAAALKAGDVDIVYLLSGPTAQDIKRTPGLKLVAARPPGPISTCRSSGIRSRRGTTGAYGWPPATPSIATR
jgi:extracellular solute-binding protein (family 5)